MTQSAASLVKVEEWRRKSCDFANNSNDGLHSLIKSAFDSVSVVISPTSDRNKIVRALLTLDSERKISSQLEVSNSDSLRVITIGLVEAVHLAFLHLTEKIESQQAQIDNILPKSMGDQGMQTDEIPLGFDVEEMKVKVEELVNESPERPLLIDDDVQEIFPCPLANSMAALSTAPNFTLPPSMSTKKGKIELKEEPVGTTQTIPGDNQISSKRDVLDFMRDEKLNDDVDDPMNIENVNEVAHSVADSGLSGWSQSTTPFTQAMAAKTAKIEAKREQIEPTIPSDNQITGLASEMDFIGDDMINDDDARMDDMTTVNGGEKEESTDTIDALKESSETIEVKKRRRSSRTGESLVDSDADSDLIVKKSRSDSNEKKKKDQLAHTKSPQCIMCEKYPHSPGGYVDHLRETHGTALHAHGIYLICSCGLEVRSGNDNKHASECFKNQYSIHQVGENDEDSGTPQCLLCETYPSTPRAYIEHLALRHNTTLASKRIFMICDCGLEVRTLNDSTHVKGCDRREFTLHKLNKKKRRG